MRRVSIHAPHEGERRRCFSRRYRSRRFQSTLPTRGSDIFKLLSSSKSSGFNPRSPRGGATLSLFLYPQQLLVSIHAPHEGERHGHTLDELISKYVSIHAPHEGERPFFNRSNTKSAEFQSTLPTRGSDGICLGGENFAISFNPRSPRGGATISTFKPFAIVMFQSTLPTRGSDYVDFPSTTPLSSFNPRSPRGGATICIMHLFAK